MELMMEIEPLQTDTIDLPGVPEIPALHFRRFRGESDYPNILASINGSKAADGTERADTLEEVAHNYSHLVNCDPYRDMLFAEVDGKVAGYSRVWWNLEQRGGLARRSPGFPGAGLAGQRDRDHLPAA
jgi:mycothiol synthase